MLEEGHNSVIERREKDGCCAAEEAPQEHQGESSSAACRWTQVKFCSRSPGSRVFPSAVMHEKSLYVFGGHDGSMYRNDLLVFSLET